MKKIQNLKLRLFSAAIGLTFVFTVLYFYTGMVFNVVLSIASCIAVYEILMATKYVSNKALTISSLVFASLAPFFNVSGVGKYTIVAALLYVAILFSVLLYKHQTVRLEQIGLVFFVSLVFPFSFSCLAYMRDQLSLIANGTMIGIYYTFLIFACSWGADASAFFAGKFFGKKKLAPNISPNKTVEGMYGGVFGGLFSAGIITLIFYNIALSRGLALSVNYFVLIPMIVICSIVGIFGDLSASIIKRQCAIKDFGNIMPGHGGILDRCDSMLFVTPVIFCIVQFVEIVRLI